MWYCCVVVCLCGQQFNFILLYLFITEAANPEKYHFVEFDFVEFRDTSSNFFSTKCLTQIFISHVGQGFWLKIVKLWPLGLRLGIRQRRSPVGLGCEAASNTKTRAIHALAIVRKFGKFAKPVIRVMKKSELMGTV